MDRSTNRWTDECTDERTEALIEFLFLHLKTFFFLTPPEATCTNTPGSRTCACNAGWQGNGIGPSGCVDIDECATDNGGCMADHKCINTPGSRDCQCNTGYEGTGVGPTGCTDINECLTDNGGCHAGVCFVEKGLYVPCRHR